MDSELIKLRGLDSTLPLGLLGGRLGSDFDNRHLPGLQHWLYRSLPRQEKGRSLSSLRASAHTPSPSGPRAERTPPCAERAVNEPLGGT